MAKRVEIDRPLSPDNAVLYGQIVGLELAILECNQLGIDVERVDYTDWRRPCLIVKANAVTQQMLRQGKAFNYGSRVKNGIRVYLNHAIINGVKIKWESSDYRH
ncbi:hypothetical protein EIM44_04250 [Bibersteinia trehalosi]|uniref:Uncharacterized protein n=1 Tax=Bibersteinia trehalosi TaxID=47735 RepID=A0A3R8MLT6_BIBTR|nr:hypothetical protein [Bibersteinia trehalosi]RRN04659.1 hypothetical protein EIM44_04250 [Bibersteinia trehalosi]